MFRKVDDHCIENSVIDSTGKTIYIVVEPSMIFISKWPAEELSAKIKEAFDNSDDDFFDNQIESYALDDYDSSYFDDSEFKTAIIDSMMYYVCNTWK